MLTSFRSPMVMPDNVAQPTHVSVGNYNDISSVTSVTAIRTASRNHGFASEATASVPAVTGNTDNRNSVYKHDSTSVREVARFAVTGLKEVRKPEL